MDQTWSPSILSKFRKEFGLTKSQLARFMRDRGLPLLTYNTLHRWESGQVVPKPAYELAIRRALVLVRRHLESR